MQNDIQTHRQVGSKTDTSEIDAADMNRPGHRELHSYTAIVTYAKQL